MDHCNDSAGHGHSGFTLSSQQRVKLGLMKVREQTESIMTQELDPQVINTLRIIRVIQVLYTTVFLMGLEYITVRKANKPLVQQSSQGFTSYLNLIYQTAARNLAADRGLQRVREYGAGQQQPTQ
ncbi:unnamed protein product [Fusarium graminearum]|nr:unnamed protein product [Fusarium graminearum]CAG1976176.1 unnamed protein product [Fusarium graminearum]CAG2000671.1 unnamed protein product [Fusarium graminearum]